MKTDLGDIAKEPNAQAELLKKFYNAVFQPENMELVPTPSTPSVLIGIPA